MKTRSLAIATGILIAAAAASAQTISTVAGDDSNAPCSHDDGVPATTECVMPSGIAFDSQGNLYLVDGVKVRKVDHSSGVITTVAGTTFGFSGDGGPATSAKLNLQGGSPGLSGLAVDSKGNVYISDTHNCVIRLVTAATGIITTYAGSSSGGVGSCGYSGENVAATSATLFYPAGIALNSAGDLFIADNLSYRVRRVDHASKMITTVAGNGDPLWESDGVAATSTGMSSPLGVKLDNQGNLYISEGNRVRKVDANGIITTVAGSTMNGGNQGSTGDGGKATAALLFGPLDTLIDSAGNIYIADNQNLKVRKIDTSGIISTYAGVFGPVSTPLGDGGPAASAYLGNPLGLAFDAAGNLYISETQGQVRKVAAPVSPNPVVTAVVNGASFEGGGVVPGEIATVFGTNLTSSTGVNLSSGLPLPTTFESDELLVNNQRVALFAVDNVNGQQQINFQVPWEVSGGPQATIAVSNNGKAGASISVAVLAAQPGIFNYALGGNTFGAILHATFQLADTANPAAPDETVLIYCTGLGAVASPPADGEPGNGQATLATPKVSIGGTNATVNFSGLAPGFVGLYQINAKVPGSTPAGNQPVIVEMGGVSSNSVLLPVQ